MEGFDGFTYSIARDYGRWGYIVAAVLFFVIGSVLQRRLNTRRTFGISLTDSLIGQAGMITLVVAFAMQTGRFPVYLALASIVIGFVGWGVAKLLLAFDTASNKEGSTTERFRVAQSIAVGSRMPLLAVFGILQIVLGLALIVVFVWGAFSHHPDRFGDGAFVAERAIIFLTIPAAVGGLLYLIVSQLQVASSVTPPGYRNLLFSMSVVQVVSQSILIFGPFIFLRNEFEALGLVLQSDTTVIVIGGAIVTAVLVIPYLIGFLGHARLVRSLAKERAAILERAIDLSRWKDCDYKTKQVAALRDRILNQYELLAKNVFLSYLGLELLLNFVIAGGAAEAGQRRELVAPLLGDNPEQLLGERKALVRQSLSKMPQQFQGFLDAVDGNDWSDLIPASVIVRHFHEIMKVLPRLASGDPSLEYVAKDILAEQSVSSTAVIAQARPAIFFTLLSSVVPQLWRLFGEDALAWLRAVWQFFLRHANVS